MSDRRDRTESDRDELLDEISNAESILDGMNAAPGKGLTLWGRIAYLKDREEKTKDYFRETICNARVIHNRKLVDADSMEQFAKQTFPGFTLRRKKRKG